jgi:hypothetical protein
MGVEQKFEISPEDIFNQTMNSVNVCIARAGDDIESYNWNEERGRLEQAFEGLPEELKKQYQPAYDFCLGTIKVQETHEEYQEED